MYPSFDDFMVEYGEYTSRDEETGKYGYWENPNAKWDWYSIGGRWSGSLLLKSGERSDAARIKDIFFIEQTEHKGMTVEIEGYQVPAALAPDIQIMAAEATRITSYNVCYTKLLRMRVSGPSSSECGRNPEISIAL